MTAATVILAVPVPTRIDFAERIRARMIESVEAVLDVGRMLLEAKDALPHGQFETMIREDLGWSPQTARRFMAIARHPVLGDRAHVRDLPPSWGTLAELARVKPAELEAAIENGAVRPDMSRDDTREIVYRPERRRLEKHREELRREQDWRAQLPPLLEQKPTPAMVLRDLVQHLADTIGGLDAFRSKVAEALEGGAFGAVRKKIPHGSEYGPAEYLADMLSDLEEKSEKLGEHYDVLAPLCGLPTREQA